MTAMVSDTASSRLAPQVEARLPARALALRRYLLLAAAALLAALGFGLHKWLTRAIETTDNAQVDADIVPLSARVGGTIARVHVRENQQVTAGTVLFDLDPAEFEVRVRQAKADLAAARARAAAARARVAIVEAAARGELSVAKAELSGSASLVREVNAQMDSASAGIAKAESAEKKARVELERTRRLHAQGSVPQSELDAAQAAHEAAAAALDQARAALAAAQARERNARSQVGEARGRVAQNEPVDARRSAAQAESDLAAAEVQAATAALERAELDLASTHITAPHAGLLSKLAGHPGQYVQPGQPLVNLVAAETYVTANFKETQIGSMRRGQRVTIRIDAFPDREWQGRVQSLSPGTGARFSLIPADNASGNFVKVVQRVPVHIVWEPAPPVPLRAGLSAEVSVHTD